MARVASSPWTSSRGFTRVDSCAYENFRGYTRNICPSRLRSNFLAVCEVRPSLRSRQRSLQYQERVGVMAMAGLIEGTDKEIEKGLSEEEEAEAEVKVDLNVTNLGNNTRRVVAKIAIQAPLEAVWGVLTDYNHLADHIPGLAESLVQERRPNGARLLQIGQKKLALGLKFKAKAVVEVTEEAPQVLHDGLRFSPISLKFCLVGVRDMKILNTRGLLQDTLPLLGLLSYDLEVVSMMYAKHLMFCAQTSGSASSEIKDRTETYLSYILEVQPKRWMPVALIERILAHEITCNLVSVRNVALRNHYSL